MTSPPPAGRITVLGAAGPRFEEVLTPAALAFLACLDSTFARRRHGLLTERRHRSDRLASGSRLDFPRATSAVRDDPTWRVAPPAPGLADRRVEITGPPDRDTARAALRSGAQVWTADFEDATSPLWHNLIAGQLTLLDAVTGRLDGPTDGHPKADAPTRTTTSRPTLMVRPRGWHLDEEHLLLDGRPVAAALVDFGLYFFHCARRQIDSGSGPYFYLPKLENRYEARLWNDVFVLAQQLLDIPRGTVRATVLIETVPAAFEMEEILYELREHAAGLNAGRWDYLFSLLKTFGHCTDFLLPDRTAVTMNAPFMRAYTELLVDSCHRRGAPAIGGMVTHLPDGTTEGSRTALATARHDAEREAAEGFDGAWVTRPELVPVCREAFDRAAVDRTALDRTALDRETEGRPHATDAPDRDRGVTAADLLAVRRNVVPPDPDGIRTNVAVALRYFDTWLGGHGVLARDGLLEDTATAEIARVQLWQWLRHRLLTRQRLTALIEEEYAALAAESPGPRAAEARAILESTVFSRHLPDFFTPGAYTRYLVRNAEVPE
ncbi:malate synthase A [Streptomyces sp. NPDC097619]|uniref:malate synthase n=1 Tax=Streptomyces sp. NPDC097619 TaxID=3157228 RepID=UPI0033181569